ncbi:MAG: hypothetical protein DYG89_42425 [Caldilinea sp. CFX5]|nr:hypothetical protein [Caldilinea sp. CFX5]
MNTALFHSYRLAAAIDSHDEPFYGKRAALRPSCCGGAAKADTTHFFRIATAYVIHRRNH